jgi:hypothetical protein
VLIILLGSFIISTQQLLERKHSVEVCETPHINNVRRGLGMWLGENTDENAVIALKEVDQSAYYSRRKVLSMDATLNSKAIPSVKSGKQLDFLQQEKPDYLVIEEDMYALYPDWKNSDITPLINHAAEIGEIKELNGMRFTLEKKFPLGGKENCSYFQDDYFWYVFEVNYE